MNKVTAVQWGVRIDPKIIKKLKIWATKRGLTMAEALEKAVEVLTERKEKNED
jgi:hypothetical protein